MQYYCLFRKNKNFCPEPQSFTLDYVDFTQGVAELPQQGKDKKNPAGAGRVFNPVNPAIRPQGCCLHN